MAVGAFNVFASIRDSSTFSLNTLERWSKQENHLIPKSFHTMARRLFNMYSYVSFEIERVERCAGTWPKRYLQQTRRQLQHYDDVGTRDPLASSVGKAEPHQHSLGDGALGHLQTDTQVPRLWYSVRGRQRSDVLFEIDLLLRSGTGTYASWKSWKSLLRHCNRTITIVIFCKGYPMLQRRGCTRWSPLLGWRSVFAPTNFETWPLPRASRTAPSIRITYA